MSAYMCSEVTLNRIITGFSKEFCNSSNGTPIKRLLTAAKYDLDTKYGNDRLMYDLVSLNERSLLAIYQDRALSMFSDVRYTRKLVSLY